MQKFTEQYDVVVVGAGHAGCEAAMAAARMGLKTALFTLNVDLIAQMSCNPAVGGIAKGHLVREVDALGGIMGEVTDAVGIQFRLLNTSRGPAVWSPRAQCDKQQYRLKMREVLESQPNLHIKQAEVAELIVKEAEHLPRRHGDTENGGTDSSPRKRGDAEDRVIGSSGDRVIGKVEGCSDGPVTGRSDHRQPPGRVRRSPGGGNRRARRSAARSTGSSAGEPAHKLGRSVDRCPAVCSSRSGFSAV